MTYKPNEMGEMNNACRTVKTSVKFNLSFVHKILNRWSNAIECCVRSKVNMDSISSQFYCKYIYFLNGHLPANRFHSQYMLPSNFNVKRKKVEKPTITAVGMRNKLWSACRKWILVQNGKRTLVFFVTLVPLFQLNVWDFKQMEIFSQSSYNTPKRIIFEFAFFCMKSHL